MIEMGREMAAEPFSAYPNLMELTGYVTGSGYSFEAIFEYGLELILDALERESSLNKS